MSSKSKWERKSYPTVKATSYTSVAFVRLLKPEDVDLLDFTGFGQKFSEEALEKIYPKQAGCGILYPSPQYLMKGSLVRKWRELGEDEQKRILDQYFSENSTDGDQSSSPSKKRKKSTSVDNNIADKRQRTPNKENQCRGITKETISKLSFRDKGNIARGFFQLIGKAYRQKGNHISRTGEWNHGDNVAGFVVDSNNSNFSWKCVQYGTNDWGFHLHGSCVSGTIISIRKACCPSCWENREDFYEMCRDECRMHN